MRLYFYNTKMLTDLFLNISSFISFRLQGWKFENHLPEEKRYVLLAGPHTSNWDFYYAIICFRGMKVPVKFAIKNEWIKFPFKTFMLKVGAIGIERASKSSNAISTVDAMTNLFKENKELIVCITPEGTRKRSTKWKTGFYHVAVNAGVPIALGHLDYKKKHAGIHKFVYPSGDMEKDMREIMDFYKTANAKFPELFSVDERYV